MNRLFLYILTLFLAAPFLVNSQVSSVSLPKNYYAFTLQTDWQGKVWVGLSDGNTAGALGKIENDSLILVSDGTKIPNGSYHTSTKLPDGSLLFGGSVLNEAGKLVLVWVSESGIDTLHIPFNLKHSLINCISIVNRHEIWLGTPNGLLINNRGRWQHFTSRDNLPDNFINSITQDIRGIVWVGTEQGLAFFQDGELYRTEQTARVISSVTQIFNDRSGYLWCGSRFSSEGVSVYNGQVWETFSGRHGLTDNSASIFYQDIRGRLWVGSCYHRSRGGVSVFDGNKWESFDSPENLAKPCVDAIISDSEGRVWFGGSLTPRRNKGLSILDGDKWHKVVNSKTLTAERVIMFFNDKQENLWISSMEGLYIVNPKEFVLDLP